MHNQGLRIVETFVWCWLMFYLGNIFRFYIVLSVSKYFRSTYSGCIILFVFQIQILKTVISP